MKLAATMTSVHLCEPSVSLVCALMRHLQGDGERCQLMRCAKINVPLPCRHLAASENSFAVAEWLLQNGARVNSLDRFKRTPLEVRLDMLLSSLLRL